MLIPILLTANLAMLIRRRRKATEAKLRAAGVTTVGAYNALRDQDMFETLAIHDEVSAWEPYAQSIGALDGRTWNHNQPTAASGELGNEAYLIDLFGEDVYHDLAQANDW